MSPTRRQAARALSPSWRAPTRSGTGPPRFLVLSPARSVGPWIQVALDEIAAHRVDPPHASRVLATLSVAMERAAADVRPAGAAGAAVDGAASTVLAYFFREDEGRLHGVAARAELAAARPGNGEGFAFGRRIGEELVARAENDG